MPKPSKAEIKKKIAELHAKNPNAEAEKEHPGKDSAQVKKAGGSKHASIYRPKI